MKEIELRQRLALMVENPFFPNWVGEVILHLLEENERLKGGKNDTNR